MPGDYSASTWWTNALGHNDLARVAVPPVALLKAVADGSRQVGMNPGDEFRGGGQPLQKLPLSRPSAALVDISADPEGGMCSLV
jgi:hypothetical protein